MAGQTVVVLGGGTGGLVVANLLGRSIGEDNRVVLVDRRADHLYQPSFPWLMMGRRSVKQITRPLSRLEKKNVEVLQDEVQGIDPDANEVRLADGGTLGYDYLVISLGLQTAYDNVPGAEGEANHCWEMGAAERAREDLERFNGGRFVVGISSTPFRCPPAPYEVIWQVDDILRQRQIRDKTEMIFFSPEPAAYGGGKTATTWVTQRVEARGVKMHWNFTPSEVDAGEKVVKNGGEEIPYDYLFMVPKHKPAQVLIDSGVAGPAGVDIEDTDRMTTRWPNIYAIGDATSAPLPKSGGMAHMGGDTVAHNIASEIKGEEAGGFKQFRPQGL
ncbi:MAG: FAD-dependent oxidoreductase [Rubrobacteraceae bacterium]